MSVLQAPDPPSGLESARAVTGGEGKGILADTAACPRDGGEGLDPPWGLLPTGWGRDSKRGVTNSTCLYSAPSLHGEGPRFNKWPSVIGV